MTSGFEHRAAPETQWTLVRLKDQCRLVRNGVLSRSLASKQELDALRPLDEDNYNQHIHYYAQLVARRTWERFVDHGSDWATAKLLAALNGDPVEVILLDGRKIQVHPKSHVALAFIADRYRAVNWLNEACEMIRAKIDGSEEIDGPPFEMLEQTRQELDYQNGVLLWAICHEGEKLPWPYDQPAPESVPDEYMDLHPLDVSRIEAACAEANATRLQYLPKPKERGKGVSADVFFAQRARVTGSPVKLLRESYALCPQVAEVVLAGHRDDE